MYLTINIAIADTTKTKSTTEIAPIVCVEYDAASLEIATAIVPQIPANK